MRNNRVFLSVVLAITTFVAFLAWYGLKSFLSGQGNWLLTILGFLALLVFLCLGWLILKSKVVLLAVVAVVFLSFFAIFGFNFIYLAAAVAAFLLFVSGSQKAIQECEARIKLKLAPILKSGLPLVLTGLSVMIAVAYFYSPLSLNNQEQIQIPRALFDVVVQPAINFISKNLPQNFNLPPIDLQNNSIDTQTLLNEILGKENNSVKQQENLYQTLNQEVNRLFKDYKKYLAISLAVSLFFALKFIGMLFIWLAVLLAWLVFKLLLHFKAISIQEKEVLKEVIEL